MSPMGVGVGVGERRYSVPSNPMMHDARGMHSEDLHAWSIYRQNLNSDFTDSALGSTDKSPLPYGNFQLRDTTVQSILSHPRYGPKSALGSNMFTYLKFGLPRVFPPNHNGSQRSGTPRPKTSICSGVKPPPRMHRSSRAMRETSSGYDSSDNETVNYKQSRKYRSDPDLILRVNNLQNAYPPHPAPAVPSGRWASEADLLRGGPPERQSYLPSHIGSRMSKGESHMSLAHSRKHSTIRPGDFPDGSLAYLYPNYYVSNLEITSPENRSMLLVSGLSFEVRSSEILAVLATSDLEATGLLDVLAGVKKRLSGEIYINGQPVPSQTLRRITGYVRADTRLCPDMSVENTLCFHAQLKKPSRIAHVKMDTYDRINVLIEELGLEQVRMTPVARLTRSEIRRLNIACELLADPAILILDQPTREMDIFDTFFVVEYLRNLASTGKLVIMSLHPPTYEIFAMLTKVVLISAGRTMYSGYRKDMLPYFASIDYPCPAFKNPSDYYLDLVTLDELSSAALLESSGRVEAVAGIFASRPFRVPRPPPAHLPSATRSCFAFGALLRKSLIYTQLSSFTTLTSRIFFAALLSLFIGTIFWDLPTTDPQLIQNDRFGFHYSVMCLSAWPLFLLMSIHEVFSKRSHIERDIKIGLYSRFTYVVFDQAMELISCSVVWLAYLIPSYAMSSLYIRAPNDNNGFYIYLGVMLLYLLATQMFVRAVAFLVPYRKTSTVLSGLLLLLTFLVNGFLLSVQDLPSYTKWLEYVSPSRWTLPQLLNEEFEERAVHYGASTSLRCRNKQMQRKDIIVQSTCPPLNGTQVLQSFSIERSESNIWETTGQTFLIALAIFYAVFAIVAILAFVLDCTRYGKRNQRKYTKGHKTIPNAP